MGLARGYVAFTGLDGVFRPVTALCSALGYCMMPFQGSVALAGLDGVFRPMTQGCDSLRPGLSYPCPFRAGIAEGRVLDSVSSYRASRQLAIVLSTAPSSLSDPRNWLICRVFICREGACGAGMTGQREGAAIAFSLSPLLLV